ncbi:Lrp/AsnC family transcriptional regulator [Aneurinibacillus aneurinilyticus]|uniref:Lrp/AsnC family transcriptional regulator n=1 Tax=Aneurinibacillus aneurinilyticus TaxID=1391 RepID=A0A848D0R2_ANEAE|nr:Lrp/AsnC family transcriptional regulator [Aneurinibacillus aneurinilyticus]MED0673909.1 Lrp/AsnC family transcriptional regulator [Aneurinibacillus aneurinilyticus]NMF00340.1 Lrp/AsnC family transcriptional regulator [Aneurinibacillus aneurinilyticus]
MKIDEIDIKILSELQKDSRLSMRELSKRVNLSAPSVTERVNKMEDEGIIEGYSIKINRKKLGYSLTCLIEVTMRNGEYEKFRTSISKEPRCLFCYRVAGQSCFILLLSVKTIEEIEEFINSISSIAKTNTYITFSEIPINRDIKDLLEEY